jgi:hypothetical protein
MASGVGSLPKLFGAAWLIAGTAACSHATPGSDPARASVSLPSPGPGQPSWKSPPAAYLTERNLCIDRELARRNLNEFGDPRGTTYAKDQPQGISTTLDRYNYVLRHRPDIAVNCTRSPDEQER